MNRIDRLTAIIILLQSRKIVTAAEIAEKYDITIRTVYRDIRALEEAGVPICAEAGLGYYLMKGYSLPPVMLTKDEAGAILIGQKLMQRFADKSALQSYEKATDKIKSVLPDTEGEYWDRLDAKTHVLQYSVKSSTEFPNHFMSSIQKALYTRNCILMDYYASHNKTINQRTVEPVGVCFYGNTWHMIAYCQLRDDYRDFRVDRIKKLSIIDKRFEPHRNFSLENYFKQAWEKTDLLPATIRVKKELAGNLATTKYYFGFITEKECENCVEFRFMINDYDYIANWILSLGEDVIKVEPAELHDLIKKKIQSASKQYLV